MFNITSNGLIHTQYIHILYLIYFQQNYFYGNHVGNKYYYK